MAKVAFIGLGNMGGPMAINLVKAGHQVTAFDLSEAALAQVKAEGASVAASAADAGPADLDARLAADAIIAVDCGHNTGLAAQYIQIKAKQAFGVSGTLACIWKAISYWLMRVMISGS